MARQEALGLWVAVDSLKLQGDRFAIWVLRSPHPSGHVHYDCDWSPQLADAWQSWQSVFSVRGLPQVPHIPSAYIPRFLSEGDLSNAALSNADLATPVTNQPASYSSRYMQHLGMNLWQWLFAGPVKSSLERAQGIAIGQDLPLRLRLEIRDPELISLPWEIMQRQAGSRALSLKRKILFSRTSSDVDSLEVRPLDRALRILLVLGKDSPNETEDASASAQLKLEQEAALLKKILEKNSYLNLRPAAKRRVDMLVQPSAAELSNALETGGYNVFFYSGHGMPGPDGGLLFLSDTTLSGTELSQVLLRAKVRLAVFNTCWGAQPEESRSRSLPRSSLAEVLLHHGLPAVVAMRDSIADEEAVSFIQAFAQALAERKAVDEAVAIARQHLLTLYHFNQPAWTLPVLYMHPDFDGELLLSEETTQINQHTAFRPPVRQALLRDTDDPQKVWPIYSDVMRIGRKPDLNDLVISDPWVSSRHAEIFHRRQQAENGLAMAYFLRDNSRYGTFYRHDGSWQEVHRREVALRPGTQIRFGSQSDGQLLEFVIES
ncbi:CHAT domain-containing protein [cf. Phormidesmis sp. LEGE 11477]|uniref:CHAT domain-containing protein n=1 Tax=cf. Phormidesmis sp. LEGE 11477 TaxID=1828680 RepID=UPI0018830FEA|nr:CHAT domain-containing protein [cf. Phormidesmis sp. LEGE 11477]MBE9061032.1 CHAT domain-containing protein [cf. Phormidesmis sp. LEGE 11477]